MGNTKLFALTGILRAPMTDEEIEAAAREHGRCEVVTATHDGDPYSPDTVTMGGWSCSMAFLDAFPQWARRAFSECEIVSWEGMWLQVRTWAWGGGEEPEEDIWEIVKEPAAPPGNGTAG